MDEFYASTPESTPEKKSSEDSAEIVEIPESPPIVVKPPGAMAKSTKGQSKVLPDLVPLFEVEAGSYGEEGTRQVEDLADEMVPGVKASAEPKEKKQKDIRAFFEHSPSSSPKPKIRSPSPEVMLVDAPRRSISLIDLTKRKKGSSPNRKGLQKRNNLEEKRSAKKRKSDTTDAVTVAKKVARQEPSSKKVSQPLLTSETSNSVKGGTIPDVSKESKSSLTNSEISKLLEDEVKTIEPPSDNKRRPRPDRELKTRNDVKVTKEVKRKSKERVNRIGEKRENSDSVALAEAKTFSPEKVDTSESSLEQRRKRVEMMKKEKELE